jgi:hypothetical protein
VEALDEPAVVAARIVAGTSRSVCVIASGVRSSWEALAANLCCSPTCASSRASAHMSSGLHHRMRILTRRRRRWSAWERVEGGEDVADLGAAGVVGVNVDESHDVVSVDD